MTGTTWQGDVDQGALPATVRADFPFFSSAEGAGLAYLDNAATTQKPAAVLAAVTDYYTTANGNVGRGYYRLSMTSTDRFEAARTTVQRALGAEHPDEVLFTSGTTHAVNLLAGTLGRRLVGRGDQVLVTGMEHNSNLLPWRRLCEEAGAELVVVPADTGGTVGVDAFAAALGPRVRLAAVAHVSNVLGTVNPVRELVAAAHRHGVPVVVDGAQAVPHRPVDVRALGVDFYCFSAHKVYGPMGVGVLYGRRELLADLPPYQVGGGTVKGVAHDEPVRYLPGPPRWEAGTPDVAGAVGLAAALDYLDGLGRDAVRAHDAALVRYAVTALGALDRVRIVGDPARDPSGIVSFVVDGIHPYDVGGHLDRNRIAVRCGVHCASAFLDELGLLGTVRLSFGVYNTTEDVDRVRDAVAGVRPGYWTAEHPTTRFL
ncbi:aminotransferase class V-fold PLP-dependent enzyme [Micromonospora olivasterospora]|uniref:cysteine desulfurase n=1 Tax=Micromonospora olivasterospora TaxID=1880 RepID=A0A562I236_MICOL|nr:cysteine desulfurase [Micromonospora olivasterospora]TWH65099.1 cysteine desulfurase/selenocysteine lyase [Micromonospora olivasterospora]